MFIYLALLVTATMELDIMQIGMGHKEVSFKNIRGVLSNNKIMRSILEKIQAGHILSAKITNDESRELVTKSGKVSTIDDLKKVLTDAKDSGAKELMLRPPITSG